MKTSPTDRYPSDWPSLPGRITRPVQGELLRGYLVRLAAGNHTSVDELHAVLNIDLGRHRRWLGLEYDQTLATDLKRLAGLDDGDIANLHVNQGELKQLRSSAQRHPTHLRTCPTCMIESGTWQRRWTDPLNFVCHRHQTLLVEHDENLERLKVSNIEDHTLYTPWQTLIRSQTPAARLVEIQTQLDQLRVDQPKNFRQSAERMLLRLVVALTAAIRTDPEAVADHFDREFAWLTDLGYAPIDAETDAAIYENKISIWTRVQHIAMTAQLMVQILEDAAAGNNDVLEDARDALIDIAGTNPKASPSIADPWEGMIIRTGCDDPTSSNRRDDSLRRFWAATRPEPATQERYRQWRRSLDDKTNVAYYRSFAASADEFAQCCEALGIPTERRERKQHTQRRIDWTRSQCADALRRCHADLHQPITANLYNDWRTTIDDPGSAPTSWSVADRWGDFTRACDQAGVEALISFRRRATDKEVEAIIRKELKKYGDRRPTMAEWDANRDRANVPGSSEIKRRFGSWPVLIRSLASGRST